MKTAIIGLGPHGSRLLQCINRISKLELVGLVDTQPGVLEKFDLPDNIKYTQTKELYQNQPDLELVLIATNGPSHANLAIEAMDHNVKYILVEKPMACSVEDCLAMERKAAQLNVRLAISKPNRFDDVYVWLRERALAGDFGDIRSIYIQKPGIGLGCLGTHSFDLSNFLMTSYPTRVTGWVDPPININPRGAQFVDPGGLVVLEYPSGARTIISQIEDGAGPLTVEIHYTGARVIHDPKNNYLDVTLRDLAITPGPGRPPAYSKLSVPEDINIKGDLLKQITALIDNLISDEPVKTQASHGTSTIEILAATYFSNKNQNTPVDLPLNIPEAIKYTLPIT